jgi:hypothetical protein
LSSYYDPEFNGTDNYWKHPFGLLYTDSVADFAKAYGAYWVLDVVASYLPQIKKYDFLVLYFDVEDSRCLFHAKEDTDLPDIIRQEIEFTDLTVSVKLYFVDGLLMFPSDY